MKQQKLTQAMLKEGSFFWRAYINTNPDTQKSSVEISQWIIKSVLNRRPEKDLAPVPTAFFVQKVEGVTWIRLSKKTGDYGWSPSIDSSYRMTCHLGYELPDRLATTKSRACQIARANIEEQHEVRKSLALKFNLPNPDDDPELIAELDQERAAADRASAFWKGKEEKGRARS